MPSSHPNARTIRRNRVKLLIARIMFATGVFLILLDIYFIYIINYWHPDILWLNFILACGFLLLSFGGRFRRAYGARRGNAISENRRGECIGCGACCQLPVRCMFYWRGKCIIWKRRFGQCRDFPASEGQMVSYDCGYYFEGDVDG